MDCLYCSSLTYNNFIHAEICLTSNLKTQTVPSYDVHHFGFWFSNKHPLVICVSVTCDMTTIKNLLLLTL